MTEITVAEDSVYENLPEFEWEKYQRGFLGILNNAYNQSCNSGTKTLGDMSKITSEFDGGSFDDFLNYYYIEHDGEQARISAIERMADNLVSRVESVGGELERHEAIKWSRKYVDSMIVNSYKGFMSEEKALNLVAAEREESWRTAPPEEESEGIDGYVGGKSVQVKPISHTNLDINSFDVDMLVVYEYHESDEQFVLVVQE